MRLKSLRLIKHGNWVALTLCINMENDNDLLSSSHAVPFESISPTYLYSAQGIILPFLQNWKVILNIREHEQAGATYLTF